MDASNKPKIKVVKVVWTEKDPCFLKKKKKKDIKTTDAKKGIMLSPSDKEYKELMRV